MCIAVLPWMLRDAVGWAVPLRNRYRHEHPEHHNRARLGVLWFEDAWRLACCLRASFRAAANVHALSLMINVAIGDNLYKTGNMYDLPLIASFLWYGMAGWIASKLEKQLDAPTEGPDAERDQQRSETTWQRDSR